MTRAAIETRQSIPMREEIDDRGWRCSTCSFGGDDVRRRVAFIVKRLQSGPEVFVERNDPPRASFAGAVSEMNGGGQMAFCIRDHVPR